MVIALPDLIAIAVLLLALAMISAGKGVVDLINWFIQNTVGLVPGLGSIVAAPFDKALQAISNFLGSAAATFENYLGICFHLLAASVEWVGREVAGIALLDFALAERLARDAVGAVTNGSAVELANEAAAEAARLAREGISAAKAAELASAAAVGALAGRVGTLEGDVADVIEPSLEALRARAREIEDGFQRAWDLLKQHEEALGIGAVTAAVAVAIDELGSSWIRCDGVGAVGNFLCGLGPALLDALLAATFLAMTTDDVCQIVTAVTNGLDDAKPVLDLIVDGVTDLLKCQGADMPQAWPLKVPTLPPPQAPAALPLAA